MKKLLGCVTLGSTLSLLASGQAIVERTNCPKVLSPGTIVAAQSVSSLANYPVVILACYTLNPSNFSINNTTTPPTIDVIGGVAGNPGGSAGQFQINSNGTIFGGVTFSGDATVASNGTLTLNSVNGNPLTCGDTTHSCTLTINGKGLITASSNNLIASQPNYSLNEFPSGTEDGTNLIFNLAHTPIVGSVDLWLNGLKMSLSVDYNISGATITFTNTIPQSGDIMNADYRY
jgi:hypothetical protein